jgi:hypothetical protein
LVRRIPLSPDSPVERCTYHSKAEKPCYAMVLSREKEHVSSVRCLPYTQFSRIESSLQPPEKLLPTIDIYCWSRPAATHPTHQVPSSSEPSSSTSPSPERTYPEGRFGSRFRFFFKRPAQRPSLLRWTPTASGASMEVVWCRWHPWLSRYGGVPM